MQVIDGDKINLSDYMSEPEDVHKIRPASEWAQGVIDALYTRATLPEVQMGWQKTEGRFAFRKGELTIWGGINGHGKALSLDTEIPTIGGWTTMGDIRVGDIVFDERGEMCSVTAFTEVMIDRPCYRLTFSDGTQVVADENHEWMTYTMKARQSYRNAKKNARLDGRGIRKHGSDQSHKRAMPAIRTTGEIAQSVIISDGCWQGKVEHSIPVCGSLKTLDAVLPIDPYVLGVWLGDGDSYGAGLTSADEFIVEQMVANGINVTKRAGPYHYGLTGGFQSKLRSAGLLRNKHVPAAYLRASDRQRLALLQGLMDTDGHVTDYGRCEFTSTNKGLADATHELVQSLGIQAKIIEGRATLNGKDCGAKYRVTFTPSVDVFRLPRKSALTKRVISDRVKHRFIVACERVDSVPVRCIEVDSPSHMYLATRAMIPTHNSMLTSQVALDLCLQNQRVCMASLEMKPEKTMLRMTRQAAGDARPPQEFIRSMHSWTDERLWLYDHTGSVKPQKMLAVARYAIENYRIEHFFIDNLMKCVPGDDDYNGQKDFVNSLTSIAQDTGAHLHLIAHVKKGGSEYERPGKFDVKGSGSITDLADNLFIVWRNKRKEAVGSGKLTLKATEADQVMGEPDCFLSLEKQRNGDYEGVFGLWFDGPSMQYVEHRGQNPRKYPVDGAAVDLEDF